MNSTLSYQENQIISLNEIPCQTVYVIDDDPEICEALSWLLESADINVKSYTCGNAFLEEYAGGAGCIILDVRLKDISGLKLQEKLNNKNYQIPIIFITGHGDVQMAVRAMKNGACDFLQKPFNSQDLLECVQAVLEKNIEKYKKHQQKLLVLDRVNTLTPREKDILLTLVEGKQSKKIAGELDIAENTVGIHRASVKKKMKVKTTAELVTLIILNDIVDDIKLSKSDKNIA